MDTRQIEEMLAEYLQTRPEVQFTYLFGSLARGQAGPLSDVDLGVYVDPMPTEAGFGYRSVLLEDLMRVLRRDDVDLVILNQATPVLRHRVLRDGKLVFCRSPRARVDFQVRTLRDYQDIRPLLEIQGYYLRKRLREGRFGGGAGGR